MQRSALVFLLLVHVALGVGFGLVTPLYEAPDEENHYLFIRYLVERGTLPVQDLNPNGPRGHHPPLYYLLAVPLSAWIPQQIPLDGIDRPINPSVDYRYGDPRPDNKNKYLQFFDEDRWPYRGQALGIHLVRLLSTAFSAVAVVFTYLAGRQLRPHDPVLAWLAAGLIALNAMVLFMAGIVQNSTAALASGAATVWALARIVVALDAPAERWPWRHWAVLGGVLGISLLLQTSALTLLPVAGAVWLFAALRDPHAGWARRGRTALTAALAAGAPILALTGWWFWRNWTLYGDPTANRTIAALWTYGPIQPLSVSIEQIATGLVGRFGQGLMIDFPAPVYWIAWLGALIAFAAAVWRSGPVVRAVLTRRRRLEAEQAQWALHVLVAVSVTVWLFVYVYYYIHGLQGRYLFTAFPSLALLFAGGLLASAPAARGAWVAAGSLALALVLPVYGLFGLLLPTYSPPRAPTTTELTGMSRLDATVGDLARVHGYWLESETAAPGDLLQVHVVWEPLARSAQPYTVFAHALDPARGSLGQQDTYPGGGLWATTVWDPGRLFVDTYYIRLAPDLASGSTFQIVLGLYDATTMQRLPVRGADAGATEEAWVRFGQLVVAP